MSTRNYQSGDGYGIGFTVKSATGALADADSLPAAVLYHNGSVDGSVTVTVTRNSTGDYSANCTLPGGYAAGDRCSLKVTATIGGIATGEYVDHIRLVGWPNTALPNAAAGASGGVPLGDSSGRVTITQAFPANFASLAIASGTGYVSTGAAGDPLAASYSAYASQTGTIGYLIYVTGTTIIKSVASGTVSSGTGTNLVITAPSPAISLANLGSGAMTVEVYGSAGVLKGKALILSALASSPNVALTLATPIDAAVNDTYAVF